MDKWAACECAYKNGYAAGLKVAQSEFAEEYQNGFNNAVGTVVFRKRIERLKNIVKNNCKGDCTE